MLHDVHTFGHFPTSNSPRLPVVGTTMKSPAANHERAVTRTFFALGSGEAMGRGISFLALLFLARVLGVEAFGVLELAVAIVIYGNRVADLGFDLGLGVREIAAADDERRVRLLATALLLRGTLAVAIVGILVAIGLLWLPSPEGQVIALYAVSLVAVGVGTRWLYLGLQRSRLVAATRVFGELVVLAIVLAVVRGPSDLPRVPLARIAGDVVAAIILFVGALRLVRLRAGFDRAMARDLCRRGYPLVASAIFGLMVFNADLIFLRVLEGRAAVGYYAAAYTVIAFLSNLGAAYSLSLLPALTRLAGTPSARAELYRTAHAHVMTVGLAIAVGGTLLAGPIVSLVFGEQYARSALPLAILLWSVPLALTRDLPIMGLLSNRRERPIAILTGQAAGLNVMLNLALIPIWGLAGAAVATVITELLRLALAVRAARQVDFAGPSARRYLRPIAAAAGMGAVIYVMRGLPLWIIFPAGIASWLGVLGALGALRRQPGGSFSLWV